MKHDGRPQSVVSDKNQWIPKGERLPRWGRQVLIYSPSLQVLTGYILSKFGEDFRGWVLGGAIHDATHWAKIPAPLPCMERDYISMNPYF